IYHVQSPQTFRLALSDLIQLPGQAMQIIISLRHARAIFRSPGKSVEKSEVSFRRHQALLISLAVYVNQVRLYRFQQSDIGDLIIDKYPSPPACDQFSSDQSLAIADIHAR